MLHGTIRSAAVSGRDRSYAPRHTPTTRRHHTDIGRTLTSRPDDDELLRRAQDGDLAAFSRIVLDHQSAALRLATLITGDSTEAYDIVQEAFVKVHHAIGGLRSSESLRPWIMRIVANQAKNTQRSRWRHDRRLSRHAALRPDATVDVEQVAINDVQAQDLLASVAHLNERDRRIIGCRYFADLSEAETAHTLGIAIGTVKSQTARALTRLRAQLGDVTAEDR